MRLKAGDPAVLEYLARGVPVVLTESELVRSALHWDLDYMASNMGDGMFTVYSSKNPVFRYHDPARNAGGYRYEAPTRKEQMTFADFKERAEGAERPTIESPLRHYYLQQV